MIGKNQPSKDRIQEEDGVVSRESVSLLSRLVAVVTTDPSQGGSMRATLKG